MSALRISSPETAAPTRIGKVRDRQLFACAIALALALLLLSEAIWRSGTLQTLEAGWGDLWFRLAGERHRVERVVIVEIDEATLSVFPDDPLVFWTPHFARAAAILRQSGARLIALDMLFSVSPERWLEKIAGPGSPAARQFERGFREQLAAGGVILGAAHRSGPDPMLPRPELLAVLPDFDLRGHLGATNLELDRDGTWRRVAPLAPGAAQAGSDGLRLLSFPLLLALRAEGLHVATESWTLAGRQISTADPAWPVAFAGPPGTVPRLSLRELLTAEAGDNPRIQALRDKIVIIGPGYGGSNDLHLTPYGHGLFSSRLMSGPEVHAQALEALLAGRHFSEPGATSRIVGMALLLGITMLAWLRLRIWRGSLLLACLLAAITLAAYLSHRQLVLLPLAHAQIALLLLYAGTYSLRLAFGERERARVRSMFARYVSREVVDALIDSGEMPALGGKTLEATVLFCDIRNFTSLSERLPAEAVVAILNRWFAIACTILREEGGSVDKFIGDAVMAEFGTPLPQPDHARRALRAGLRLSAAVAEMREWMAASHAGQELPPFAIGVGIHSGTLVAGNIGSPDRMDYTVIGDTANLASRLESATKTLGCVVAASAATLERAGEGVVVGGSQVVAIKGKAEPVEVFAIEELEDR